MVHKELCQHPIKARGFHDVDCNFYRIHVTACQVNTRHACLVLITPFDLVQFVKRGLTRDIQDHLNVRVRRYDVQVGYVTTNVGPYIRQFFNGADAVIHCLVRG